MLVANCPQAVANYPPTRRVFEACRQRPGENASANLLLLLENLGRRHDVLSILGRISGDGSMPSPRFTLSGLLSLATSLSAVPADGGILHVRDSSRFTTAAVGRGAALAWVHPQLSTVTRKLKRAGRNRIGRSCDAQLSALERRRQRRSVFCLVDADVRARPLVCRESSPMMTPIYSSPGVSSGSGGSTETRGRGALRHPQRLGVCQSGRNRLTAFRCGSGKPDG